MLWQHFDLHRKFSKQREEDIITPQKRIEYVNFVILHRDRISLCFSLFVSPMYKRKYIPRKYIIDTNEHKFRILVNSNSEKIILDLAMFTYYAFQKRKVMLELQNSLLQRNDIDIQAILNLRMYFLSSINVTILLRSLG